jgi:hypothetical protein
VKAIATECVHLAKLTGDEGLIAEVEHRKKHLPPRAYERFTFGLGLGSVHFEAVSLLFGRVFSEGTVSPLLPFF